MRELEALEQRMAEPGFWNDQKAAQTQLQRRKRVESDLELLRRLKREEDDAQVLGDWLAGGEDVARDFETALDALEQTVETCEFQKMLGGEHDRANAILTINAGTHTFTLDDPQNYMPAEQRLLVADTSVAFPLQVTFSLSDDAPKDSALADVHVAAAAPARRRRKRRA